MDFGRAITYAFNDPDWLKKLGLAALVSLIPVIGSIIVLGWEIEITRNVINDEPQPLPGWDNFGDLLSKGFQAFVAALVYALPIILVVVCGQVANFGLIAAGSSQDSNTLITVASIVSLCMTCFIIIFALAVSIILPAALGNLAVTGQLGSAFRFNEVLGLVRAAIGPYLMVMLGVYLASLVLAPVGALVCGIGLLATVAYLAALRGHLTGQAYKAAKAAQAAAPAA